MAQAFRDEDLKTFATWIHNGFLPWWKNTPAEERVREGFTNLFTVLVSEDEDVDRDSLRKNISPDHRTGWMGSLPYMHKLKSFSFFFYDNPFDYRPSVESLVLPKSAVAMSVCLQITGDDPDSPTPIPSAITAAVDVFGNHIAVMQPDVLDKPVYHPIPLPWDSITNLYAESMRIALFNASSSI
jgi:hypothetical protein